MDSRTAAKRRRSPAASRPCGQQPQGGRTAVKRSAANSGKQGAGCGSPRLHSVAAILGGKIYCRNGKLDRANRIDRVRE